MNYLSTIFREAKQDENFTTLSKPAEKDECWWVGCLKPFWEVFRVGLLREALPAKKKVKKGDIIQRTLNIFILELNFSFQICRKI